MPYKDKRKQAESAKRHREKKKKELAALRAKHAKKLVRGDVPKTHTAELADKLIENVDTVAMKVRDESASLLLGALDTPEAFGDGKGAAAILKELYSIYRSERAYLASRADEIRDEAIQSEPEEPAHSEKVIDPDSVWGRTG